MRAALLAHNNLCSRTSSFHFPSIRTVQFGKAHARRSQRRLSHLIDWSIRLIFRNTTSNAGSLFPTAGARFHHDSATMHSKSPSHRLVERCKEFTEPCSELRFDSQEPAWSFSRRVFPYYISGTRIIRVGKSRMNHWIPSSC